MNKQLIVIECAEGIECDKIEIVDDCALCQTYANPAAVQHRQGRMDACGVMLRPAAKITAKKTKGQGKTKAGGNR